MITVAIVGILLAVAYPSFLDQLRKSRRADAVAAITAVQQAQERFRSNQPAFSSNLTALPSASPPGLGLLSTTATGYYTIALRDANATGYVVTATAATGSSQASDGTCVLMAMRIENGNVSYGSGASEIDWADPGRCWAR